MGEMKEFLDEVDATVTRLPDITFRMTSENVRRWLDYTRELEAEGAALAAHLLEIAELAMPGSYFESDSRCNLARDFLKKHNLTGGPNA